MLDSWYKHLCCAWRTMDLYLPTNVRLVDYTNCYENCGVRQMAVRASRCYMGHHSTIYKYGPRIVVHSRPACLPG